VNHVKFKCTLGWEKCDKCNHDSHDDLFLCTVCGGAEASLPTECPGRKMTSMEEDAVQAGKIDFKNGEWTTK
jgi:hypothetical protein